MPTSALSDCRRVAVLSDIHGNYHAFRACYEDALSCGVDGFVFLGDYISDLSMPRQTLDLLRTVRHTYPTLCLRGNRERYMLENRQGLHRFAPGTRSGSLWYTYSSLTKEDLDWFDSLPTYVAVTVGGTPVELAHAAEHDDRYYFDPDHERLPEVLGGMRTACFLTGHSHKQYAVEREGKLILNPGSVGVPREYGYLTQYAILDLSDGLSYTLRQIPYDVRAAVRHQMEHLLPVAGYWAIGVLYDVLTGEEWMIPLLQRAYKMAGNDQGIMDNEDFWQQVASSMGMRFTEAELLALLE